MSIFSAELQFIPAFWTGHISEEDIGEVLNALGLEVVTKEFAWAKRHTHVFSYQVSDEEIAMVLQKIDRFVIA